MVIVCPVAVEIDVVVDWDSKVSGCVAVSIHIIPNLLTNSSSGCYGKSMAGLGSLSTPAQAKISLAQSCAMYRAIAQCHF